MCEDVVEGDERRGDGEADEKDERDNQSWMEGGRRLEERVVQAPSNLSDLVLQTTPLCNIATLN